MTLVQALATAFCIVALLLHLLSVIVATARCRSHRSRTSIRPTGSPSVTILRPVRGIDQHDALTLGSGFALRYPDYELIFCCADATDPVVELINRLIAEHPHVRARLLIGDDRSTANPKLNNLIKGWHAASHEWVVLADSNVLMPDDYLQRLFSAWRPATGVLCSPPVGCMPVGFWAEMECAFLNTYQARWQYTADSIGLGFAQGKTMLWRRATLDAVGGIRALGVEIAEDAAATKIVRAQGLQVHLVDQPFFQPLGFRTARQIWDRQLRWARLRRVTFPQYFIPELLTGSVLPFAASAIALDAMDLALEWTLLIAFLWYGSEAILARLAGWHMSIWSPLAWLCRDLALPILWIAAWMGNSFIWRGNDMRVQHNTLIVGADLTESLRPKH